ncbi:YhbD family protein [Cohnella zeiphila]|uniref:YhbD family protein n=1 Tax=Cohnella zeiphila TaxID=2761120 RepID=A0A7X0VYM2_9BACL|nr:YhbD family protein [Cohnella zeiphila]MBB6734875.1 YhbD family protein [Cohnella zeiphila]
MSDRELISKKDLLETTGISYGQLYRWKRKQLIPEEWFIRKSTFTGQETFFPKDLIMARIDRILNMKEDLSLDELAGKLSPLPDHIQLRKDELVKRNIVSGVLMERFGPRDAGDTIYSFEQALVFYVADRLLRNGEMSLDEAQQLLDTMKEHFGKFEGKPCELYFIRKMGVSVFLLASAPTEIHVETGAKLVARLSLSEMIEQLQSQLT